MSLALGAQSAWPTGSTGRPGPWGPRVSDPGVAPGRPRRRPAFKRRRTLRRPPETAALRGNGAQGAIWPAVSSYGTGATRRVRWWPRKARGWPETAATSTAAGGAFG